MCADIVRIFAQVEFEESDSLILVTEETGVLRTDEVEFLPPDTVKTVQGCLEVLRRELAFPENVGRVGGAEGGVCGSEIWIDRDRIDIRRLRGVIERMFMESPDASVVVLSDQNSRTGIVVEVIDQARLAGAGKVALAAAAVDQGLAQ